MTESEPCQHLTALTKLKTAPEHACPECVALGDTWVHLRVCQQCGHVGCCDSSQKQARHQTLTTPPSTPSWPRPSPASAGSGATLHEEMAEY